MAFMGDSLDSAPSPYEFETTMAFSPANPSSGVPYQVWESILEPGGPGDPTWEARVDNGFTSMDTLYAGSDGVHSFLAAAELQLYYPAYHPWAEWIADAVHRNAPGVLATVQTSPPVNLDLLMQTVQSADFLQHWNYPFTPGLPYSGEPFQTALQGSVTEFREAIASLVAHLPGAQNYNTLLQPQLDHMTDNVLVPVIETANNQGLDWWYIAQVHGELDEGTGQYRRCDNNGAMLRPPSPAEIHAMVNLGWQRAHNTAKRAFTYFSCTVKFS